MRSFPSTSTPVGEGEADITSQKYLHVFTGVRGQGDASTVRYPYANYMDPSYLLDIAGSTDMGSGG